MMRSRKYNPQIHHRRSIRLKGYDYSQAGLYFITICCQHRECRFGRIVDDKMQLNEYGRVAEEEWVRTCEIRPNVELGEYVIMPDHMHAIIRILDMDTPPPHQPAPQGGGLSSLSAGEPGPDSQPQGTSLPDGSKGELHSPLSDLQSPQDLEGECNSPLQDPESPESAHSPLEGSSPLRPSGTSQTVGAIVRGYKGSVTRRLTSMGFTEKLWLRNYYERIIRDEQAYHNIANYILNNPGKWKGKKFYTEDF